MGRNKKKKELKDVPNEVWMVWGIQYTKQPIGMTMYNKCQDIIRRYPEYFEWETRYNKVPESVHKAYAEEMWAGINPMIVPKFDDIELGEGIDSKINPMPEPPVKEGAALTNKSLTDLFDEFLSSIEESEKRAQEEANRARMVWNKHYGVYGLEYRG